MVFGVVFCVRLRFVCLPEPLEFPAATSYVRISNSIDASRTLATGAMMTRDGYRYVKELRVHAERVRVYA